MAFIIFSILFFGVWDIKKPYKGSEKHQSSIFNRHICTIAGGSPNENHLKNIVAFCIFVGSPALTIVNDLVIVKPFLVYTQ